MHGHAHRDNREVASSQGLCTMVWHLCDQPQPPIQVIAAHAANNHPPLPVAGSCALGRPECPVGTVYTKWLPVHISRPSCIMHAVAMGIAVLFQLVQRGYVHTRGESCAALTKCYATARHLRGLHKTSRSATHLQQTSDMHGGERERERERESRLYRRRTECAPAGAHNCK